MLALYVYASEHVHVHVQNKSRELHVYVFRGVARNKNWTGTGPHKLNVPHHSLCLCIDLVAELAR